MTRGYISSIYASRGPAKAMAVARRTMDHRLILEVMVLNYLATGFADPIAIFKTGPRGKQVPDKSREGASLDTLAEVKAVAARREPLPVSKLEPQAPKLSPAVALQMVGNLRVAEATRRANALAASRGVHATA